MNRFYIDGEYLNKADKTATIVDSDTIKHMTKSLRLSIGDDVEISAGEADNYVATITDTSKESISLALKEPLENTELPVHIDLYQGVPKGQKWEILIQKSVECGVRDIYPVQMARSVSQIKPEQADKKRVRWQKIATAAAKQSKRSYITNVQSALSVDAMAEQLSDYDLVLIAYENEATIGMHNLEQEIMGAKRIAIVIGPEGGIDDAEIETLNKLGHTITLGKRILRTETAGMVMLARLSYIIER